MNTSLNSLKILSDNEGEFLYSLSSVGWLTMQIGWGHFLCVTSMPSLGKLSFPRMFRSCTPVMMNGVSSLIHPLDCVLTNIFPNILIVWLVNPQYKSFILFSTGCILRFGYLSLILCNTFCFKKLTGLAESTGKFIFTIISQPMPKFRSFCFETVFNVNSSNAQHREIVIVTLSVLVPRIYNITRFLVFRPRVFRRCLCTILGNYIII